MDRNISGYYFIPAKNDAADDPLVEASTVINLGDSFKIGRRRRFIFRARIVQPVINIDEAAAGTLDLLDRLPQIRLRSTGDREAVSTGYFYPSFNAKLSGHRPGNIRPSAYSEIADRDKLVDVLLDTGPRDLAGIDLQINNDTVTDFLLHYQIEFKVPV